MESYKSSDLRQETHTDDVFMPPAKIR